MTVIGVLIVPIGKSSTPITTTASTGCSYASLESFSSPVITINLFAQQEPDFNTWML